MSQRQDPAPHRAAAGDARDRAADRQRGHQHAEDDLAGSAVQYSELLRARAGHRHRPPAPPWRCCFLAATWYLVLTACFSVGQYYLERYYARGSCRQLPPTPLAEGAGEPDCRSPSRRCRMSSDACRMTADGEGRGRPQVLRPPSRSSRASTWRSPRARCSAYRPVRLRQVDLPALHQPPGEDQRRPAVRRRRAGRLPAEAATSSTS